MSERAKKGSLKGMACEIERCTEPMHARRMCKRHYKQFNRAGKATPGLVGKHGSPQERFWNYVEKRGPDECWEWTGNCDKDGYGSLRTPDSQLRAHRLSFEMHNPDVSIVGLVVRHSCNNPPCVNPAHLLRGTNQDNVDDKVRAGRQPVNEVHANTKFSNEVVIQVRAATGLRKDIAKQFGISPSQVGNIRKFKQRPPIKI